MGQAQSMSSGTEGCEGCPGYNVPGSIIAGLGTQQPIGWKKPKKYHSSSLEKKKYKKQTPPKHTEQMDA